MIELIALLYSLFVLYAGFIHGEWFQPSVFAVAGVMIYYLMRQSSVAANIQEIGAFKTAAFLYVTQALTAYFLFGVGYLVGLAF